MLVCSPHTAASRTTEMHLPIGLVVLEDCGVCAADILIGLKYFVNRDCRLSGVNLTTLQEILSGDPSGLR